MKVADHVLRWMRLVRAHTNTRGECLSVHSDFPSRGAMVYVFNVRRRSQILHFKKRLRTAMLQRNKAAGLPWQIDQGLYADTEQNENASIGSDRVCIVASKLFGTCQGWR
jgi:hypothetical protein